MSTVEVITVLFKVLSGLALFIFGMNIMTDGLRETAGRRLRRILAGATRNRVAGIILGTFIGFLVQSSAGTVMLVGFINAGLMSLAQSVPPMLGINIGTTLSMQMISFKLGDYCFLALVVGLVLWLARKQHRSGQIGAALFGFGLLFLGMSVMSGAIKPYRAELAPLLAHADGSTWSGMLVGVGIALAITAVIQSSGATIGMVFAMIAAGVITRFEEAYPIILGANVGTCATALLGSIGTNIDARRSAISHLVFNVFSCVFGIVTAPIFFKFIPHTSTDLIHQAANANTIKMILSALVVLPFVRWHVKVVLKLTPSRKPPPEPSFLDEELLSRPEDAVVASIRELRRVSRICGRSLNLQPRLFFNPERSLQRQVRTNEDAVDDIKVAMLHYLGELTNRYLSRRQAVLVQHLHNCIVDLERVADHIKGLSDVSQARHRAGVKFSAAQFDDLFRLHRAVNPVMHALVNSFETEHKKFHAAADEILTLRGVYMQEAMEVKADFVHMLVERKISVPSAVFFWRYVSAYERMVRHMKAIARTEDDPLFRIKKKKLNRETEDAPDYVVPPLVDPEDYLDNLQREDYI